MGPLAPARCGSYTYGSYRTLYDSIENEIIVRPFNFYNVIAAYCTIIALIYKHGLLYIQTLTNMTIHEFYSRFVRTRPPAPAAHIGTYASKNTHKQNEN